MPFPGSGAKTPAAQDGTATHATRPSAAAAAACCCCLLLAAACCLLPSSFSVRQQRQRSCLYVVCMMYAVVPCIRAARSMSVCCAVATGECLSTPQMWTFCETMAPTTSKVVLHCAKQSNEMALITSGLLSNQRAAERRRGTTPKTPPSRHDAYTRHDPPYSCMLSPLETHCLGPGGVTISNSIALRPPGPLVARRLGAGAARGWGEVHATGRVAQEGTAAAQGRHAHHPRRRDEDDVSSQRLVLLSALL